MHALVELSSVAVWVSGISPVLDDWLAHFLSNHALDQHARIQRFIHVCNDNIGLVKELTKVYEVYDPTECF